MWILQVELYIDRLLCKHRQVRVEALTKRKEYAALLKLVGEYKAGRLNRLKYSNRVHIHEMNTNETKPEGEPKTFNANVFRNSCLFTESCIISRGLLTIATDLLLKNMICPILESEL